MDELCVPDDVESTDDLISLVMYVMCLQIADEETCKDPNSDAYKMVMEDMVVSDEDIEYDDEDNWI